MADLVSVIIPTFNRVHTLTRAIDSALGQTHGAVEVVVVDDGSTDGTSQMVATRYGRDPRVRYRWQENAGAASARNRGIADSQGTLIAFLDADDWWRPWKLELQLAALRAFPAAGMVWSGIEAVGSDGTRPAPRHSRTLSRAFFRFPTPSELFSTHRLMAGRGGWMAECGPVPAHCGDIGREMLRGDHMHVSTVLIRRRWLSALEGFDPALEPGEDFDFHLRSCFLGPVAFVDAPAIRRQIGTPDRCPGARRARAVNFLTSVTRAVRRHGARLNLPDSMLEEVLGEAHRRVAEAMIDDGDRAAGRRHYRLSLRHRPWQWRAYVQIVLCCLPPTLEAALRSTPFG